MNVPHHYHHQPINHPTAGAQAFLMNYTYRERTITHHTGPGMYLMMMIKYMYLRSNYKNLNVNVTVKYKNRPLLCSVSTRMNQSTTIHNIYYILHQSYFSVYNVKGDFKINIILIHTYHSLFIPEGSRGISNIPPRHPRFTKIS
jgi:hypothetical protein